jgi:hypothetical protein
MAWRLFLTVTGRFESYLRTLSDASTFPHKRIGSTRICMAGMSEPGGTNRLVSSICVILA